MISQILAVIIFLAMFILIITEVWERHIVTLGCALLTLVVILGICMRSPSAFQAPDRYSYEKARPKG